jgi:hypothetical protein
MLCAYFYWLKICIIEIITISNYFFMKISVYGKNVNIDLKKVGMIQLVAGI